MAPSRPATRLHVRLIEPGVQVGRASTVRPPSHPNWRPDCLHSPGDAPSSDKGRLGPRRFAVRQSEGTRDQARRALLSPTSGRDLNGVAGDIGFWGLCHFMSRSPAARSMMFGSGVTNVAATEITRHRKSGETSGDKHGWPEFGKRMLLIKRDVSSQQPWPISSRFAVPPRLTSLAWRRDAREEIFISIGLHQVRFKMRMRFYCALACNWRGGQVSIESRGGASC